MCAQLRIDRGSERFLVTPKWGRPDNPYPMTDAYVNTDHDGIDPVHFRALHRVVEYFASKETIADLIMFTTVEESFGTEEQDHRLARYLLVRYASYPNVIWCLTNEWNYTKRPIDYWNRLGRMMRSDDPWVERGRYIRGLSIHQKTRCDWNFFGQNWYSHVIVQLGVHNRGHARRDTDEWKSNEAVASDRRGVFFTAGRFRWKCVDSTAWQGKDTCGFLPLHPFLPLVDLGVVRSPCRFRLCPRPMGAGCRRLLRDNRKWLRSS